MTPVFLANYSAKERNNNETSDYFQSKYQKLLFGAANEEIKKNCIILLEWKWIIEGK